MDPFKTFELASVARADAYRAFVAASEKNAPQAEQDRLFGELEAADEAKTEAEQEWAYARGAVR